MPRNFRSMRQRLVYPGSDIGNHQRLFDIMRKITSLFLSLLSIARICAQGNQEIAMQIRSMPDQGFSLDKVWKFQPGDNPDWAKPAFNDSLWPRVDLAQYGNYLKSLPPGNIAWFRTRILLDSQFSLNQIALVISQLGASELYLNGNLLLSLGQIHPNGNQYDNPHGKPFLLHVSAGDTLAIAIRYASQVPSKIWLFSETGIAPLSIKIRTWNQALDNFESSLQSQRIPFGISFMCIGIGIVFILLYFFYPDEKMNLLYGALCLLTSMIPVIQFQLAENNLSIGSYGMFFFLESWIDNVCSILVLSIISIAIFGRINFYQGLLMVFVLLIEPAFRFNFPPGLITHVFGFLSVALLSAEFLRLSFYAFLKKDYFIALTSLVTGILHFSGALRIISHFDYSHVYYRYNLAWCMGMIGVYLAWRFTNYTRLLLFQLQQMNRISKTSGKSEAK